MKLSLELSLHREDLPNSARCLAEFEKALLALADSGKPAAAPIEVTPGPVAEVLPEPAVAEVTAPVEVAPPTVELDKAGLPWDGRIHSDAAEKKTKEGHWKRRRGVADELVATVEAELRGLMALPAAPVVPVPPAPEVPTPPAPGVPAPVIPVPPAPVVPVPPPPPPAATGGPTTLVEFMKLITPKTASGELSMAKINEALVAVGLASIPQLNQRPDLIPTVARNLGLA